MSKNLSPEEIDAFLSAHSFGHLGCSVGDRPCVFPMAYAFHDNVLYGQTTVGKKVEIIRNNPNVCFQVEEVMDEGWKSVMCWGTFQELDFVELRGAEASDLVKLLTEKLGSIQKHFNVDVRFSFKEKPLPQTTDGKRSTLFRIVITEKSGRFQAKNSE